MIRNHDGWRCHRLGQVEMRADLHQSTDDPKREITPLNRPISDPFSTIAFAAIQDLIDEAKDKKLWKRDEYKDDAK